MKKNTKIKSECIDCDEEKGLCEPIECDDLLEKMKE